VRYRGLEFSLIEFSGAFGDFGTLLPFALAYITINGLEPFGIFFGIGITNIILALIYRLPLPVQPKKAVGAVAIRERWHPNLIYGTGIALGLIWLLIGATGSINRLVTKIPKCVLRGIQLGLGLILAVEGASMIQENLILGGAALIFAIVFMASRRVPTALILVSMGVLFSFFMEPILISKLNFGLSSPTLHFPSMGDMIYGLVFAGFAQLLLTLTNAIIATIALIHDLFPDRKDVTPRNLVLNMGFMNTLTPFIGAMPMCHGAGGLAAQYSFGARTGGACLMEGVVEILLALFLAGSIDVVAKVFPFPILGAMLMVAGLQLGRVASDVRKSDELFVMLLTAVVALAFNIAAAFFVGLVAYLAIEKRWIKLG